MKRHNNNVVWSRCPECNGEDVHQMPVGQYPVNTTTNIDCPCGCKFTLKVNISCDIRHEDTEEKCYICGGATDFACCECGKPTCEECLGTLDVHNDIKDCPCEPCEPYCESAE